MIHRHEQTAVRCSPQGLGAPWTQQSEWAGGGPAGRAEASMGASSSSSGGGTRTVGGACRQASPRTSPSSARCRPQVVSKKTSATYAVSMSRIWSVTWRNAPTAANPCVPPFESRRRRTLSKRQETWPSYGPVGTDSLGMDGPSGIAGELINSRDPTFASRGSLGATFP